MTDSISGASQILLLDHWKPVVGRENYYEVSNCGYLRNLRTGKLLSRYTSCRYTAVTLSLGAKSRSNRTCKVHILVTDAFFPPCPLGMERNHIDGNKQNNRTSNIEYVTHQENVDHAIRLRLRKTERKAAKLTEQKVAAIKNLYGYGLARSLGVEYGVSKTCILDIVRGVTWRGVE